MSEARARCLYCGGESDQVPVLSFEYKGGSHGICSAHLPLLIHDPARLAGKLADADKLPASEHED